MIILDTDCLSLLERDNADASVLRNHLAKVPSLEAATTIINFEEQMRGWLAYLAKARTLENQVAAYEKLSRFLDNYRAIPVLPFEQIAAAEFRRFAEFEDPRWHDGFENCLNRSGTQRLTRYAQPLRL